MKPNYQPRGSQSDSTLYLSVGLISLSILMLEIGLARIFSVMFESHYAFLIISLAILGLGLGGIFVHKRIVNTPSPDLDFFGNYLHVSSALMALSILLMLIFILKIPPFQHIYLTALMAFIPFFFGGIFLATAFRLYPDKSAYIYATDLVGASVGSVLIVTLLNLGAIKISLLVAVLASLPACFFIIKKSGLKSRKIATLLLTGGLILTFLFFSASLGKIPFAKGAHKEMAHLVGHPARTASVIESRWSTFGRTDLIAEKDNPDEKVFFIDGTAGTSMYRFTKNLSDLDRPEFNHFSGYFPFEILPEKKKEKVLIIGAGGGREVLISLLGGAKEVTAVEVNKDLADLMKKYSDFNGGIYNGFPGVKVVVEEGRNFIRSTREQYDIIMLSIPVTKTSRSPEGFALTENFLFTVESINDYLDRLKPDGQLIVVAHEDMEIFRLVFTGLSALKQRGIPPAEAMKYIYTVGPEMFPVFVLKKSPFTPQEADSIHQNMHKHAYSTLSSFIPFVEQVVHKITLGEGIYQEHRMLNDALYLISRGGLNPEELVQAANFDLNAVTDNNPFFYKFEIGLPSILTYLLVLSTIALMAVWFIKPGISKEGATPGTNILFLILFSFLGIGFMLIEIPLIQKFILFLGQPTYAIAVLLSSLLIGAGAGSWFSGFIWQSKTLFKFRVAVMAVGVITGAHILFLDQILTSFLGNPFSARILLSFSLLLPLGFFLGMPFPLGMKLLDESGLQQYVPRMWGVNGIGSVFGSTLSIALSIEFGFSYAMALGAILYISLFVIFLCRSAVVRRKN